MSQNYDERVEEIAREILVEEGLNDRHWQDAITGAVNSENYDETEVLKETTNEPDASELAGMMSEDDKGDWRAIQRLAAFLAMERDVSEAVYKLQHEYIECDDCNSVVLEEEGHEHADGTYCPVCHKKRFRCDIGKNTYEPAANIKAGIYYTHELDSVDFVLLKDKAEELANAVIDGKTPIGLLLDRLQEAPDEILTEDAELKQNFVEYLRKKYPFGNETWEMETFLDISDTPVRDDVPHEDDDYMVCGGCGYGHEQCDCKYGVTV